jgi:TusA-related sulfurtransferase
MSSKSVFCMASSSDQADTIVQRLKDAGFSNNSVSVLFPDKKNTRDFAHEKKTKLPEGGTIGAGAGGAIGGTLGWLAGIGALAIPGIGPFIAAGPIMAALGGAAIGGAVGGLSGMLIGLGVPELEAKQYEGKIKEGNILISVHTDDPDSVKLAKEIFENEGAEDISDAYEAAVPKKGNKEGQRMYSNV